MKTDPRVITRITLMSAALILAIVSLTSIMQLRRDTDSFIGSGASTEGNVEGTAPAPVATSTAGSATKTPAPAKNLSLTYSDAINLFGGYRFQFTNCSGAPGTLNVTKGSTFLLDNRDDVAHTIKVGAQSYSLGAYGFRIATASTMGANQITCDGKGAAVVNVQ